MFLGFDVNKDMCVTPEFDFTEHAVGLNPHYCNVYVKINTGKNTFIGK